MLILLQHRPLLWLKSRAVFVEGKGACTAHRTTNRVRGSGRCSTVTVASTCHRNQDHLPIRAVLHVVEWMRRSSSGYDAMSASEIRENPVVYDFASHTPLYTRLLYQSEMVWRVGKPPEACHQRPFLGGHGVAGGIATIARNPAPSSAFKTVDEPTLTTISICRSTVVVAWVPILSVSQLWSPGSIEQHGVLEYEKITSAEQEIRKGSLMHVTIIYFSLQLFEGLGRKHLGLNAADVA